MQPINEGKPSGLVGPDGRPIGETPEERVVREFHHFANVANSAFKRMGSQRVALGFTFPNKEQAGMAMSAVQRWPLVVRALVEIEKRAGERRNRAEEMHDTEIGSEAQAFGESANMLRMALSGTPQQDGKGE